MLVRRGGPILSVVVAAVLVGVAFGRLSAPTELLIVAAAIVLIATTVLATSLRASALGAGIGLAHYAGVWITGLAVALISYNAVRVSVHLTASDLVLLLASGGFAFIVLADRSAISIPWWLAVGVIGLLTAGFLSTFATGDLTGSIVATGEFALALLGVPILLAFVADAPARLLVIANIWLGSVAVNAAIALSDFLHITAIGAALTGSVFGGRPPGLTIHPNHLGMACAMVFPVGLFLATSARRRLVSVLYFAAVALIGLAILISGSRAALLAAVAGTLLVLMLGQRMWKPVLLVVVLGAVFLWLTPLFLINDQAPGTTNPFVAIERLTNQEASGSAESNAIRLQYYSEALTEFARNPVTGTGFNLVRDAHDIYFQLLAAGGVLALLSFGVFALGSVRLGLELTRRVGLSREMHNLAAALTASLIVWLLAGLVQNLIYDRFLYVPTGLLIGLQLATRITTAVPIPYRTVA